MHLLETSWPMNINVITLCNSRCCLTCESKFFLYCCWVCGRTMVVFVSRKLIQVDIVCFSLFGEWSSALSTTVSLMMSAELGDSGLNARLKAVVACWPVDLRAVSLRQGLHIVILDVLMCTDIVAQPVEYFLTISFRLASVRGWWAVVVTSCVPKATHAALKNFPTKWWSIIDGNTVRNVIRHDQCIHRRYLQRRQLVFLAAWAGLSF